MRLTSVREITVGAFMTLLTVWYMSISFSVFYLMTNCKNTQYYFFNAGNTSQLLMHSLSVFFRRHFLLRELSKRTLYWLILYYYFNEYHVLSRLENRAFYIGQLPSCVALVSCDHFIIILYAFWVASHSYWSKINSVLLQAYLRHASWNVSV